DVNSLNTILAIAIMFGFCNGKIILFTEINNSKRGYPTFWTAPCWEIREADVPFYRNARLLYDH
ncbi:hypothetical protein, partial [Parabacteroides merdae]|uniref:hypothetical protein n=1 Tax=Parabacteroides merdae TaxID=46503 RepID=UPI003C12FF3E